MKAHSFHREAEAEYVAAVAYYAKISPRLGRRFYEEIERLLADICTRPTLYRRHVGEIRRHISMVFPYGLLYENRQHEVRILAVMHLQRNPDYWRHRQSTVR